MFVVGKNGSDYAGILRGEKMKFNECKTKLPSGHICGHPTYGKQHCLEHTFRDCPRRRVSVSMARCKDMREDGKCPGQCVEVRKERKW